MEENLKKIKLIKDRRKRSQTQMKNEKGVEITRKRYKNSNVPNIWARISSTCSGLELRSSLSF